MALNGSGPISLGGTTAGRSIEIELGGNGTTQISLNDTNVRTLAGVPSGAITMPTNFWGKANRANLSFTYSSNTANASLNVTTIGGYIAGKSDITITVNSGVYLYSTTTGGSGLTLSGGTSGDTITLVNNGYIMGQGGAGGAASPSRSVAGSPGTAGGPALSLGFPTTVNNTNGSAYIGGGGGGGGGGGSAGGTFSWDVGGCGGGGAGGGNAGAGGSTGGGSAGGGVGASGASGSGGGGGAGGGGGGNGTQGGTPPQGGGGGRIFPGSGGSGGGNSSGSGYVGGAGGSANAGGSTAPNGTPTGIGGGGGGGGGWGASGGNGAVGTSSGIGVGSGGGGGRAVTLNGNTITWTSGNTTRVYGAVA